MGYYEDNYEYYEEPEIVDIQSEEDAQRQAEEEAQRQAEEEAQRQAEEEAKRQAEEEAQRQAEEEAQRQAEALRQQEIAREEAREATRRSISEYETKLYNTTQLLSKCESSYESLVRFKNEYFNGMYELNRTKKEKVEVIRRTETIKARMCSAQKYEQLMSEELEHFVSFNIENLHISLETYIETKLNDYRVKLQQYENDIAEYGRNISDLQYKLSIQ